MPAEIKRKQPADSSSSEEEVPIKKSKKEQTSHEAVSAASSKLKESLKNKKAAPVEDSDSDSDEPPAKTAKPKAKAPAKKAVLPVKDDSSSDDEPAAKPKPKPKPAAKKAESSDDSSDDKPAPKAKAVAKKVAAADSDSSDEAPKAKAKPAAKRKEPESDDDSDDEAPPAKKPKAEADAAPAKVAREGDELQVFVGGLPFNADEATLKKDFGECGPIAQLKLLTKEDGSSTGCCFITYETKEGVDAALKFDGEDYGGRWLKVNMAGDRPAKGKGKDGKGKGKGKDGGKGKGNNDLTVFVGGLSWSVDEATLKKDFGECGEVVNIRLPKNEEGQSKGIAFIEFSTQEGLDAALKFDGDEYAGRTLKVNKAGDKPPDSKGKGKDGDKGKGKGKKGKGKGKAPDASKAKRDGGIQEFAGTAKAFDDSDDE